MTDSNKPTRSLAGIAGIVAIATLVSKIFGLVRQQAIAAAFGVGAAADAYNYAYVIPGFLLVLLGGINGPFHSAIVSVVAKRRKEDIAPLVETITTLVGAVLLVVTVLLILFAEPLVDLVAPGLGRSPEGLQIRAIAIQQFRIMSPMALLAGLIGIGFGTLNAADHYWLPSISPLFSSVTVLIGLGVLALQLGGNITNPEYALLGGLVLAWGTLAGAVLQWLVQVPAQWKAGLGKLRLRFDFNQPAIREVTKIMGPATLSSGMMQINVYTALFFASFIPQAAAALGYANLLVQTPLGIISNVILVPLLPIFSRLAAPEHWGELKGRIRQGLILTAVTMLPLSALMITLAFPIVRVVYERFAFNEDASQLVTSVLIAYGIGMFFYLGRDVIVRVFYGLGDGDTPFRVSVFNIFLNALLCYFFVGPFGAPGLVFATVGVNFFSMVTLLFLLDRRLNGLPWREWLIPTAGLTVSSVIAGVACWGALQGCERVLGTEGLLIQLIQLAIAGSVGVIVFVLCALQLRLPEVEQVGDRLRQRFFRSRNGN
ncbi:murein biosynthesis integral membrane protein MurJ [Oscillatoria sp. FACHB-1407]|uniref:murein biosynthesis integral membrane protein MurJ n=1 Tax=Oscillatoria sp. FACHB-1407 TaxID=2692847 RepID=UPI0016896B52|nr:murein biosynthesis integral membrane protein MurJ [Oscillatoria sp. FACHB-1407]MBD2461550.1 murein biosynthesis integral membrane protein MurJ [Oscillatoria sp. FACHB-1407]